MKNLPRIQLAKNIDRFRLTRSLTVSELAQRSGVSPTTLHGYLQGVQPKTLEILTRLSSFFEISIDQLLFENRKSVAKDSPFFSRVLIQLEGRTFQLEIGIQNCEPYIPANIQNQKNIQATEEN